MHPSQAMDTTADEGVPLGPRYQLQALLEPEPDVLVPRGRTKVLRAPGGIPGVERGLNLWQNIEFVKCEQFTFSTNKKEFKKISKENTVVMLF